MNYNEDTWLILLTVIGLPGRPTYVPELRFTSEAECEHAGKEIKERARETQWYVVHYQCFHSGKPPLWPAE